MMWSGVGSYFANSGGESRPIRRRHEILLPEQHTKQPYFAIFAGMKPEFLLAKLDRMPMLKAVVPFAAGILAADRFALPLWFLAGAFLLSGVLALLLRSPLCRLFYRCLRPLHKAGGRACVLRLCRQKGWQAVSAQPRRNPLALWGCCPYVRSPAGCAECCHGQSVLYGNLPRNGGGRSIFCRSLGIGVKFFDTHK